MYVNKILHTLDGKRMENSTILEQLKNNDIQVAQLARDLNVTRRAVYQSIAGGGSRKIRVTIASQLGRSPSRLWTDNDKNTLRLDDALYFYGDGDVA
jgi:hypothetical protein